MSVSSTEYVACHHCDQLHRIPALAGSERAVCARCGATLLRWDRGKVDMALGLSIAALILLAIAVTYPILTFKLQGNEQVSSVLSGIWTLEEQGFWELAILVFLCSIVLPAARTMAGIYLFLPLSMGRRPPAFEYVFPMFDRLAPWAMTEVYLLALIVAYVKLTDLATIVIGAASFALMGLIAVTTWLGTTIDPHIIWNRVMGSHGLSPDRPSAAGVTGGDTGEQRFTCHRCGLAVVGPEIAPHEDDVVLRCPRCGSVLHRRKPNSISRAWALLIAATICYIPANVLPIMTVISFGRGAPSTILSGVSELIDVGMLPIAALVFLASIFIPVLKILVIGSLLVSVQRGSPRQARERTLLYRITESVGRWSMLDIFMISILAGLVKLQSLATIAPEPGAIFFAAVVILTMLAASAFDSRLIWDTPANGKRT
jgi:paraquat-inducible protein A